MRSSVASLVRDIIRDLITDVRCAERDGQLGYANTCRRQIEVLWRTRHNVQLDRYGWPILTFDGER